MSEAHFHLKPLVRSLRLLSFFNNFFQLTNSLSCMCQLHKIRTSNFLALYSLCKAEISWVIHQSAGKQPETLSHCFSIPSVAQKCHWADTCARDLHKNSTKGFEQVLGFFPMRKAIKKAFRKEESVIAADMTVKWIIQSRSSSTSILLGYPSWFPTDEFYVSPHHKTSGIGGWKNHIGKCQKS